MSLDDIRAQISRSPVAVVGNINLDIKTSPLCATPALFAEGETSVERIYESIGGGGANVAVAAAQLGGAAHFCGCIGADELGARLQTTLEQLGVVPHLRRKDTATGRSINLNWQDNRRHFISSLPNARCLSARDVDVARLAECGCTHLYRADVWFAAAMLAGGNDEVLRCAREHNMETSLDINWDPLWSDEASSEQAARRKRQVRDVLLHVNWVHGNERELCLFTARNDPRDACLSLLEAGAGGVIVHRGASGAAALVADDWVEVAAAPVPAIICATGAGDVFSAAFMMLRDLPLAERLQMCGRVAAAHLQGAPNLLPALGDDPDSQSTKIPEGS